MHRRAVHARMARGDLDGADRVLRCERPHRDRHRSVERAGRASRDRGPVHRHPRGRARRGAGARPASCSASSNDREQPSTKAPGPPATSFGKVGRLRDPLAVARIPGTPAHRCGCRCRRRAPKGADRRGLRHADQRAGLGVAQAKAQEVGREVGGQDRDVALDHAGRNARRRAGPCAASDRQPGLEPGLGNGRRLLFGGSDGHGGSLMRSASPRRVFRLSYHRLGGGKPVELAVWIAFA